MSDYLISMTKLAYWFTLVGKPKLATKIYELILPKLDEEWENLAIMLGPTMGQMIVEAFSTLLLSETTKKEYQQTKQPQTMGSLPAGYSPSIDVAIGEWGSFSSGQGHRAGRGGCGSSLGGVSNGFSNPSQM